MSIKSWFMVKPVPKIEKTNKDKNKENFALILMKYGMNDKKKVKR